MNPSGVNFANNAMWYTIVFKVSAFSFVLGQKQEFETVYFSCPKLNLNNGYRLRIGTIGTTKMKSL